MVRIASIGPVKFEGSRIVGFLLVMSFCSLVHLTQLDGQGLVIDEEVYGKARMQSDYGDGSKSESEALRNIYKVDLRPYAPRVKSQGAISSCVGWASGYGAYSIQQAIVNEWRGLRDISTRNATSAMFLYNQVKIYDCNFGSRISDALKFMKETGNVLQSEFNVDVNDCDHMPDSSLIARAEAHKIKDFEALFRSDASDYVKISKTKLSLIQNKPVIAGFNLLNSFTTIKRRDKYWFPEIGDESEFGGHAMVVVGFDDSEANGEGAFEIMNSWGEGWGNDGFIWVRYKDYARFCQQAFHIYLFEDDVKKDLIYTAEANLKRLVLVNNDGPVFSNENVKLKSNIYQFDRVLERKKDRFQLQITNVNNGMSVYVLSIDPENNIKIHWPRDEKLDDQFEGLHESAGITVPEVVLVLPTPKTALQFSKPGTEHLVFLFSKEPLKNINEQIASLEQQEGDIYSRLTTTFGDALAPLEQIKFSQNQMRFQNEIPQGQVIPVILEIKVE